MNILSVDKIQKNYGPKTVFTDLSFGIAAGEKVGLIGVNGAGKSTLLKLLMGEEKPDHGTVVTANNARIGYLAQNPDFNPENTVLSEVIRGNSGVMQLIREYETVLIRAAENPENPQVQKRLLQLTQQMDQSDAWQVESEAKTILTQLGIEDFETKMGVLSGGQCKRVALAAALINPVDLLILDEPTNHIDNLTVDWLEQYLKDRKGALLMVTHDRYFLDRVVNRIFELDQGRVYSYTGNYSKYLEQKAQREELEQATAAKRQNLFRRELAWIKRGAKARTTKQQARVERFEKLQNDLAAHPGAEKKMEIGGSGAERLGKQVIRLENLEKHYSSQMIIRDFTYEVQRRDRIGIIGPNGIGKSTMLNLITGQLQPDSGKVIIGLTVKMGIFAQQSLLPNETQRVIEYIKSIAEHIPTGDGGTISASQMLERFLFPPTQQWTPIERLSGGEKRRLQLLGVLMDAPNVLLLDEPTNDLDIQTLSILEDYLEDFPGVVIAVSHDRYFLDRIAEKLLAFTGAGNIQHFVGNYSDYLEFLQLQVSTPVKPAAPVAKKPSSTPVAAGENQSSKPRKLSFNEQRELDGIEEVIATVEEQLTQLKNKIARSGSDYLALQELTTDQEVLEQRLNELLERWTYLNERVNEFEISKNRSN